MIAHSVIILQYDAMDKYDLFIFMIYSPGPPISSQKSQITVYIQMS